MKQLLKGNFGVVEGYGLEIDVQEMSELKLKKLQKLLTNSWCFTWTICCQIILNDWLIRAKANYLPSINACFIKYVIKNFGDWKLVLSYAGSI